MEKEEKAADKRQKVVYNTKQCGFLKYIKYEENCKMKMIFGGENDKYSSND